MVAKSSLIYRLDGVPVDNPFTVEQTVRFSECPHAPLNVSTVRLKVARNFISYEGRENIIRYAMTDKVTLSSGLQLQPLGHRLAPRLTSHFDPCKEGRSKCGEHSFCRVEGNSFSCACNQGFQHLYSESDGVGSEICVDINECQTGAHDCDVNALCINEEGSYACQCMSGFVGNGQSCQKLETCEDLNCHPDAECVQVTETALQCQCLAGFTGDGVNCVPSIGRESCDQANDCSVYGACTLDATSNKYVCVCLPGYLGDGYYCVDSELHSNYTGSGVPVPTCVLGICWCPEGYDLQGQNSCAKKYDYEDDPVTDTDNSEDSLIGLFLALNDEMTLKGPPVLFVVLSRPEPACYNSTLCFCPTSYTYEPLTGTCDLPPGANSHSHGTMGPTGHKPSCNIVNTCHPHAQCVLITQDNRYRCQCDAGYEGDGYECGEIDVSCEEVDICDIHATCTYDELREKAVCLCNPGYQGDGILCSVAGTVPVVPGTWLLRQILTRQFQLTNAPGRRIAGATPSATGAERGSTTHVCAWRVTCERGQSVSLNKASGGCNILNNCDEHAQCLYDSESDEHRCVCDAGFTGDGNSCSVDHISCNVLNNCGPGAECVYDRSAGGHRCRCSQGFHGDGLNCLPDYSCQQDPNLCSRDASCVLGPTGAHTCVCNQGYVGDGSKCKAASKYEGNFLLVSQGMATLRIPFKPKGRDVPRPISIQYFQMAIGGSPEGVSVDWVSRNLYWTDSSKDTLEVAGLDSQLRKTLVTEGLVNPRGVVVHPTRGKVFWSDWNREAPKLEWANQDGSGRAVFLEGPALQLPNSLAIDFDRDELCWADAGTKSIECVGIGNLVQRTVVANCSYPFGLTISHNSYYWTDWQTQRVESAERPSGKLNKGVDVPLGGSGKLYGIVAVPEHCHRQSNVCQFDNGQCSSGHLCLPNGSGGRSCVCGENLDTEGSGEAPICNDI
uniref:Nidogen n=1 Tax=Timema monikensis TaxID=170555 RepID=A0A7R9HNH6_9NEOP|nr:unnamed protein product [Timema monikensis]